MYLFVVLFSKYVPPDVRTGPGYLKITKPYHLICQKSLWKSVLYLDNTEGINNIVSVQYIHIPYIQNRTSHLLYFGIYKLVSSPSKSNYFVYVQFLWAPLALIASKGHGVWPHHNTLSRSYSIVDSICCSASRRRIN